jgi:Carboxypeptidase regulatory-like domain
MLTLIKPLTVLRATVLSLGVGTLMACGGGGGGGGASPSTATISTSTPTATVTSVATPSVTYVSGIVKNSAGNPLAGALVLAAGQTATTGADGSYKLDASSAGENTVVLVKKSGFTTTAKEVPLLAASTTQIDIVLYADQVSTTFSAGTAANIAVNGAAVQIPANAIQTASGTNYTGTVSVGASYYSPDTAQGVQAFAGPYVGVDAAGVKSPIISMGFIEVKLTDAAGNPLQLLAGSPANLTFPASSNSGTATSVPLWFYDEAAKIWKNEGAATRQVDGSFKGAVTHFTLWNADFKGVTATIKGCFRNANGQPIDNVGSVGIRTTGWSANPWVVNPTNSVPGDFTIINVPADRPLEFYSSNSPPTFAAVAIPSIAPGVTRTLSNCIVAVAVNPSTSGVITQPGGLFTAPVATPVITTPVTPTVTTPATTVTNPVTTSTTPTTTSTVPTTTVTTPAVTGTASFAGNYRGTFTGAEVGTFAVTISSSGVISGSTFSQTYNQTVPVTGRITDTGSVSITATGSAGTGQFSGAVNAAGTLSGTWNYQQSTVGGTFMGQRI